MVTGRGGHRARNGVLAYRISAVVLAVGLLLSPQAALADEEMSDQAQVLVLQAVALIANKAPADAVAERIQAALAAPDKSRTDLAKVRQAQSLLREGATPGDIERASALLTGAIDIRFATGYGDIPRPGQVGEDRPPYATGAETGTTAILGEFEPRRGISDGGDVAILILAVLAIGLGLVLAHRWRPPKSLRQLRHQVTAPEES